RPARADAGHSRARLSPGRSTDGRGRLHEQRRSARALVRHRVVALGGGGGAAVTEPARPPEGSEPRGVAYRRFWADVGERFPDLGGAASTRYYAENERRLFAEHFPALAGLKIFKTDLWDEAKNTRILAWASGQGARAYGVDISEPIVVQARAAFNGHPLHGAVGDVRDIPFAGASFDAV